MLGARQFAKDLERFGGYEYTTSQALSAQLAGRRFSEMILSAVDFEGKSVVDVGCGDGTYTVELGRRTRARSILGIDPLEESVRRAEAARGDLATVQFAPRTTEQLLKEGRQFDIAMYRGVLHHIPDPRRELSTALRLARLVMLTEHNGYNPIMQCLHRVSPYHRTHQERSYFLWQIARWIRRGGGVVDRVTYFNLIPLFAPDAFARVARRVEPWVEGVVGLRQLVCGHCLILCHRA